MDESTASFLDKTDWRKTIHRKLEACVDAENSEWYPSRVESLVSAYATVYPGWNAKRETLEQIRLINAKYDVLWETWLRGNLTKRRWQKHFAKKFYRMKQYKEIFEYVKDRCGVKRMLLWGHKKIPGGTQMEYNEE
jgi:hypothetical protein